MDDNLQYNLNEKLKQSLGELLKKNYNNNNNILDSMVNDIYLKNINDLHNSSIYTINDESNNNKIDNKIYNDLNTDYKTLTCLFNLNDYLGLNMLPDGESLNLTYNLSNNNYYQYILDKLLKEIISKDKVIFSNNYSYNVLNNLILINYFEFNNSNNSNNYYKYLKMIVELTKKIPRLDIIHEILEK